MCHSHPFMDTFLFLIHGIQSHSLLDCSVTMAYNCNAAAPETANNTEHCTNLRH